MDQAAFLEAIVARPDDDAPRLMYADWLEERGDPQGTFIRVQCALEHLTVDDPRRGAFEDTAEDLLAAEGGRWTAPLRGVAVDWRFCRGLLEWVAVEGTAFLPHLESWLAAFPLRGLRVARMPAAALADLAGKPQLARLESLEVLGHFLRDRELRELLASPYLARLTALHLPGAALETPGIRALTESAVMPRLRVLDLGNNHAIGDQAVRVLAAASSATELHTLNLSHTNVTQSGVTDLFGSTSLRGLRDLRLALRQPRALPVGPVAQSPVWQGIVALTIDNQSLTPADLQTLLLAPKRNGVQRLGLARCQLNAAAGEVLAAAPLDDLVALDLTNNRIGPEGLTRLADSGRLAALQEMRLGGNGVRDTGAKAVAASPHCTRLVALDLSDNEIGGPGVRALAASANVANLRDLDLSKNYVNRGSVEVLADAPHLARLRTLKLNYNRLGEEVAAILAASPHLSRRLRVERAEQEEAPIRPLPLLGYGRRA